MIEAIGIKVEEIQVELSQGPYPQRQDSSWSIDKVAYSDYDLFICTGGEALFWEKDKQYGLRRGDAYLARKGVAFSAELGDKHFFLKELHSTSPAVTSQ